MEPCTLCSIPADRILLESEAAIAFSAPEYLKDGHVVIVSPRRHIAGLNELTPQEYQELWRIVARARERIAPSSDGNSHIVEVDDRATSGDSVQHARVKLISNRDGDSKLNALKRKIKEQLEQAKNDYHEFGGWRSLRTGDWLWMLIQKSFKDY